MCILVKERETIALSALGCKSAVFRHSTFVSCFGRLCETHTVGMCVCALTSVYTGHYGERRFRLKNLLRPTTASVFIGSVFSVSSAFLLACLFLVCCSSSLCVCRIVYVKKEEEKVFVQSANAFSSVQTVRVL